MAPKSAEPQGPLMDAIKRDFGSFAAFQDAFSKVAVGHFGSGWAWLVHDPKENKLKVMTTSNEVNPMQRTLFCFFGIFRVLMCRGSSSPSDSGCLGACLLPGLSVPSR